MQRTGVSSGTIVSVGYEAATSTLELEFTSGDIFQFFHVPLSAYIGFMNAGSKTDWYNHNIKAVFESKKIVEDIVPPEGEPL